MRWDHRRLPACAPGLLLGMKVKPLPAPPLALPLRLLLALFASNPVQQSVEASLFGCGPPSISWHGLQALRFLECHHRKGSAISTVAC